MYEDPVEYGTCTKLAKPRDCVNSPSSLLFSSLSLLMFFFVLIVYKGNSIPQTTLKMNAFEMSALPGRYSFIYEDIMQLCLEEKGYQQISDRKITRCSLCAPQTMHAGRVSISWDDGSLPPQPIAPVTIQHLPCFAYLLVF